MTVFQYHTLALACVFVAAQPSVKREWDRLLLICAFSLEVVLFLRTLVEVFS